MIVVCPSCHQRYRHDLQVDMQAMNACCSACDTKFPLREPRHAYRLVAVGATAGSATTSAALPGESLTPPMATDRPAPAAIEVASTAAATPATPSDAPPRFDTDLPADDAFAADAGTFAPSVEELGEAYPPAAEADAQAVETFPEDQVAPSFPDAEAESPPPARQRRAWVDTAVALTPASLGGFLAYHFAGPRGQDSITWAAMGSALGLLVGWAWLLWITRGD